MNSLERVRSAVESHFGPDSAHHINDSRTRTKYGHMFSIVLHSRGGPVVQAYLREDGMVRLYDPMKQSWINPIIGPGTKKIVLLGAGVLVGIGVALLYRSLVDVEEEKRPELPLVRSPEIIEV